MKVVAYQLSLCVLMHMFVATSIFVQVYPKILNMIKMKSQRMNSVAKDNDRLDNVGSPGFYVYICIYIQLLPCLYEWMCYVNKLGPP